MMELGDDSIAEHAGIVKLIDQYKWDSVVLVGGDFKKVPHNYTYFNNAEEVKDWLKTPAF
jgi:UDP-N-acetylmuramoyl-tripeptide--D-alanyl-D-alanine ligase